MVIDSDGSRKREQKSMNRNRNRDWGLVSAIVHSRDFLSNPAIRLQRNKTQLKINKFRADVLVNGGTNTRTHSTNLVWDPNNLLYNNEQLMEICSTGLMHASQSKHIYTGTEMQPMRGQANTWTRRWMTNTHDPALANGRGRHGWKQ